MEPMTEAWWRNLIHDAKDPDRGALWSALRERSLIAPEPDALLVEAREICAKTCEGATVPAGGIIPSAAYRAGDMDKTSTLQIALAALKRGIELAPRVETPPPAVTLTREMFDKAYEISLQRWNHGENGDGFLKYFHAALQEQLKEDATPDNLINSPPHDERGALGE